MENHKNHEFKPLSWSTDHVVDMSKMFEPDTERDYLPVSFSKNIDFDFRSDVDMSKLFEPVTEKDYFPVIIQQNTDRCVLRFNG